MDLVDRSAIAALHAAARRHRAVYLSCLFTSLASWLGGLFTSRAPSSVPCA